MENQEIKSELLEKYRGEKFGYGNPGIRENPTIWFLGPEEKGTYKQLQERIEAWFSVAKNNESFVDIDMFHKALDKVQVKDFANYYFGPNNVTQRTWKGIIEILFGFEGNNFPEKNDKKKYQRESFGRLDSTNCILELSPYQSSALNDDDFEDKENIINETLPNRIKKVAVLIKKYQPTVIFMHTEPYWGNFEKVIKEVEGLDNVKFEYIKEVPKFKYYQGKVSMYVLIYGPSYAIKGGPDTWFNLGKEIKKLVDENK
jgi:hypothetical protein